ncbi:MAG: 3-hydroxyacyl-CoA dehydrogenase NAD-binding domain-containing protein, partial [Chloroflexota bacterium]
LVIEAASESLALKKEVFSELDRICPPQCLLASNTSCLSVIDLARATKRPEKVLGLHFFNPVAMMRLIEVVRTLVVSDETIEMGKAFGTSLGKTVIVAPDTPGFVVNRLLMPFMLGAFRLFETGAVSKEAIDDGARLGLGHPMGPLKLADLVGLDTVLFIANAIYDELKDPLYAPPLLLKKMVTAGWLGRKSGRGFYDYREEKESGGEI